jgi:hypothetical protein
MTGQDGSHSNSGGAVSSEEFEATQQQITQLMQQLQALQHDIHHAPNMEDQPDNEEHVEDDDPALLPWRQMQHVVLLLEVVAEDVVLVEDMVLVLAISVLRI